MHGTVDSCAPSSSASAAAPSCGTEVEDVIRVARLTGPKSKNKKGKNTAVDFTKKNLLSTTAAGGGCGLTFSASGSLENEHCPISSILPFLRAVSVLIRCACLELKVYLFTYISVDITKSCVWSEDDKVYHFLFRKLCMFGHMKKELPKGTSFGDRLYALFCFCEILF